MSDSHPANGWYLDITREFPLLVSGALLGDAYRWLPKWLQWLHKLHVGVESREVVYGPGLIG